MRKLGTRIGERSATFGIRQIQKSKDSLQSRNRKNRPTCRSSEKQHNVKEDSPFARKIRLYISRLSMRNIPIPRKLPNEI